MRATTATNEFDSDFVILGKILALDTRNTSNLDSEPQGSGKTRQTTRVRLEPRLRESRRRRGEMAERKHVA